MVSVSEQYEAFPYPERDPEDEKKRLIMGSPSHPVEIDHFLFAGQRDWAQPLRALVAGGGTGDGLIQLAQLLTAANRPYEITYLDLSKASRNIAEARANIRALENITFVTGDLVTAPELGPFDYIDCCGVLHHLPEPAEGFRALAQSLKPDGGLGFMVYAPYGRSGVYPLQEAFGTALRHLPPKEKLAVAKRIFDSLPSGHPFLSNPHLVDHRQSDAGFYDLLLHSQDQAFDVERLLRTLDQSGLELVSFVEPAQYDLTRFGEPKAELEIQDRWALAEKFSGTLKTHVGYAALKTSGKSVADGKSGALCPHLKVPAPQLAKAIAAGKSPKITSGGISANLSLDREFAPLISLANGRTTLAEIAVKTKLDPIQFAQKWGAIHNALTPWGHLHYSNLLKS
ncbi:MAG: class I SAM-dependent methyltransferase [Boseongicola sp.]|nr:class I SAM-dependent methyltransferase [Boseongicola sp.]MDD9978452.1 class I SAM-dependent methyltransferase [Boseongicola sp.]